ncbi:MAG TPA: hypothetical protein VNY36_09420, partial [Bacteroidia bacterium]|nr:hypothetical protein [Bacteroidia bacterium]
MIEIDLVLKEEWDSLMKRLEVQFGEGIEIEGILMLIGVQELGRGYQKFSKDEKLDVLHVALCTLLEPMGYYTYAGEDADGWPQWEPVTTIPALKPSEQKQMV